MQQRVKLRIPFPRIIKPPLLNPILEIILIQFVGNIEQRMLRFDESDRRILVRDAFISENQFVGSELGALPLLAGVPLIRLMIEDDQVAAGVRVIEQFLIAAISSGCDS